MSESACGSMHFWKDNYGITIQGPGEHVFEDEYEITKVHIPLSICAPVVSQYAALAALHGPQDCVTEFRHHYLSTRNLMCKRLDRMNDVFKYHKPEGSYLMFPKITLEEGKDSTSFCKRLLKEAKVSATPGIAFGPTGQNHLRLSFCVPEEMINKAFNRMEEYFKNA